jgi:hypothetical protein
MRNSEILEIFSETCGGTLVKSDMLLLAMPLEKYVWQYAPSCEV